MAVDAALALDSWKRQLAENYELPLNGSSEIDSDQAKSRQRRSTHSSNVNGLAEVYRVVAPVGVAVRQVRPSTKHHN